VPKVGFVWKVAPTAQIFANASKSYEPPLVLELTAPGRSAVTEPAQGAEGVAIRRWAPAARRPSASKWDVAFYDIELWDEIRNTNVQPFPGAPFTIPRFTNIDRSRHYGRGNRRRRRARPRRGQEHGGWARPANALTTRGGLHVLPVRVRRRSGLQQQRSAGRARHFIRGDSATTTCRGSGSRPTSSGSDRLFVNSENTVKTPSYALGNVLIGYDYKPWKLSVYFEARNVANQQYVSSSSWTMRTSGTSSPATVGRFTAA
jgi:iron complex outermembrane receptor protein